MKEAVVDRLSAGKQLMRRELLSYAFSMGLLSVFLFGADFFCNSVCGPDTAYWISILALFFLSFFSGRIVIRVLSKDANMLWTPVVIFPLGTLLFLGFGASSTLLSSDSTRSYLLAGSYGLDASGLMRTTLLSATGVTVLIIFMIMGLRLRLGHIRKSGTSRRTLSLPMTGLLFLILGAILKYGLVLPQQYGLINVTVPGSLKSLTGLVDLGLAIMMYMAASGRKVWYFFFFILWPVHVGLSTLEFSKMVIMFAILLPAAGAYLAHQNWRRLIPWVLLASMMYMTLQDTNTAARLTIMQRTGNIAEADFEQRVEILANIASGDVALSQITSTAMIATQIWWLRLNYSGAQLRAIELYDSGRPGQWTLSLAATLIPRFLWPEKPVAAAQGREFNRIVTGYDEARSRVGMSIYADGYWKMGWLGVVLFSAAAGLILGLVTRFSYSVVLNRDLIFLPVVLMGIRMAALGPMGYLEKSFLAALPILLGYIGLIYLAKAVLRSEATWTEPPKLHVHQRTLPNVRSKH